MESAGLDHLVMSRLPVPRDLLPGGFIERLTLCSELGFQIASQDNICATARHVGGNSDDPWSTSLCNDFGFLLMVLSVQYLVLDTLLLKGLGELFRGLHRGCAHQNGSTTVYTSAHILNNCLKLLLAREVHQIV